MLGGSLLLGEWIFLVLGLKKTSGLCANGGEVRALQARPSRMLENG